MAAETSPNKNPHGDKCRGAGFLFLVSKYFTRCRRVAHSIKEHITNNPEKVELCNVCLEEVAATETEGLRCGHCVCHGCLRSMVSKAMQDPGMYMPPSCCRSSPISLDVCASFLDRGTRKNFIRLHREHMSLNHRYCPNPDCSTWLSSSVVRTKGRGVDKYKLCKLCGTKICVRCGDNWHGGGTCPDKEVHDLLQNVARAGWAQCPRCSMLVERIDGCNHMSCRCGCCFCIRCGDLWEACRCAPSVVQFDIDQEPGGNYHMEMPLLHPEHFREDLDDLPDYEESDSDGFEAGTAIRGEQEWDPEDILNYAHPYDLQYPGDNGNIDLGDDYGYVLLPEIVVD